MSGTSRIIRVAYPETNDLQLWISVGDCRLEIAPGQGTVWVSGRYDDPTGELPCRITRRGGVLRVSQPKHVNLYDLLSGPPRFSLRLGHAKPFAVVVEESAGESILDFGGLPIRHLQIDGRAGEITLDFSTPNPLLMRSLEIDTGQALLRARRLANANFGELCIGGRGPLYALDFSGDLRHSAQVNIAVGTTSRIEITVPARTAARVRAGTLAGAIEAGEGWARVDGLYCTPAGAGSRGPVLDIDAGEIHGGLSLRIAGS